MIQFLKKVKGRWISSEKKKQEEKINKLLSDYIKTNELERLVAKANEASSSTGVNDYDYFLLHKLIRTKKPKYVLECGTGRSTWVLADALQKNHKEFGIEGKVISMESIKHWYEEAVRIFPEELKQYAEIRHSEATTFMYSMIKGTCYSEVPEHPYEIVFVDGPAVEVSENNTYETANMDFIKVVLRSSNPVTAVIDYRLRTTIAYGIIFGRKKVKFLKPWNVGIVENVTKEDMLINGDAASLKKILSSVADFKYANPSWIEE